jgi:hypothetical protein
MLFSFLFYCFRLDLTTWVRKGPFKSPDLISPFFCLVFFDLFFLTVQNYGFLVFNAKNQTWPNQTGSVWTGFWFDPGHILKKYHFLVWLDFLTKTRLNRTVNTPRLCLPKILCLRVQTVVQYQLGHSLYESRGSLRNWTTTDPI